MSVVDEHVRIAPCQSELCYLDEQALVLRKELMEGRIDQADDHRESLHRPEDADEILLLQATEFLQRAQISPGEIPKHRFQEGDAFRKGVPLLVLRGLDFGLECPHLAGDPSIVRRGEDHLMDDIEPVRLHEHVLRPVQADPLRAELPGALRIPRIIRIGPHLEAPFFVRPPKERLQVRLLREVRINRRDSAFEHLPRATVDGYEIPATDDLLADAEPAPAAIDGEAPPPRRSAAPDT